MVLEGWDKQEKKIGLIFILVVAAALYLNYSGAIGRLATTCENYEPTSFNDFVSEIDRLDGTVDRDGNFDIITSSGLQSYPLYRSSSNLGLINVITYSGSCNDFLEMVSKSPYSRSAETGANIEVCTADCVEGWVVIDNECTYNTCYTGCGGFTIYTDQATCLEDPNVIAAKYTLLDQKQVLSIPDGFMWCNKENNLVLLAPTVAAFENYFSEFEVCSETAPSDNTDSGVTTVDSTDGSVDSPLITYEPENIVESNDTTTDGTKNAPATNDNSDVMWIIVASFVGVFALWWFFEKGPDKGFFQDKKKRRGKRK